MMQRVCAQVRPALLGILAFLIAGDGWAHIPLIEKHTLSTWKTRKGLKNYSEQMITVIRWSSSNTHEASNGTPRS